LYRATAYFSHVQFVWAVPAATIFPSAWIATEEAASPPLVAKLVLTLPSPPKLGSSEPSGS